MRLVFRIDKSTHHLSCIVYGPYYCASRSRSAGEGRDGPIPLAQEAYSEIPARIEVPCDISMPIHGFRIDRLGPCDIDAYVIRRRAAFRYCTGAHSGDNDDNRKFAAGNVRAGFHWTRPGTAAA